MQQATARPRRINPLLRDFITDAASAMTPKQIRAEIQSRPDLQSLGSPSLRTIQDLVSERRLLRGDTSPGWTLLDADPRDAAIIAGVLAEVMATITPRGSLSQAHAERIAWLRKGWPDIPATEAYNVARTLAIDPAVEDRVRGYLTFTPWRDGGARYVAAFAAHRVIGLFLTESSRPAFDAWAARKTGDQTEDA